MPPRNGLYMIFATMRSNGSKMFHCELWVNDARKGKLVSTYSSTGTIHVVLHLKRGDRVYMKKDFRSGEGTIGRGWSMFSGYFIG